MIETPNLFCLGLSVLVSVLLKERKVYLFISAEQTDKGRGAGSATVLSYCLHAQLGGFLELLS